MAGLGHEFTIQHRVNELCKILGVNCTKDVEAKLSEYLILSRAPFVSQSVPIHQAKIKLAENNEQAEKFIEKYEDLKLKNVRDVDAIVYFLSELSKQKEHKEIKNALTTTLMKAHGTNSGDASKRSQIDTVLDHSSNSSNTGGSGHTKQSPSAQTLAEMKEKVLRSTPFSLQSINENVINSVSKVLIDKVNNKIPTAPIANATNIELPNWYKERSNLSWDFYPNPEKFEADSEINKLSISMQEQMIIEDLLNCMVGIEGKYIKTPSLIDKHTERTFHIDRSLDYAMRELAKRILPLCSYYSVIIRFIEEKSNFKWGLVNHALCAAIRELLKNHYVFVCQLESLHFNNNLSLQKLWYYVSPIINYMEVIATIVKVNNKGECKGSSILDLLYEKIKQYSGDQKVQELVFYLAQMSSKPYLNMLDMWIHKGIIDDPYNEFMIVDDKELGQTGDKPAVYEKYWDRKYTIKRENTPKFLEQFATKILLSGKYLNSVNLSVKLNIKSTNKDSSDTNNNENTIKKYQKLVVPNAKKILFSIKEDNYKEIIDHAYQFSNKKLLDLLFEEYKLVLRIKSLKHYFLLDQSDFMVHFMDISSDEMKKDRHEIKVNRLESLLELSLRITSTNSDPYKDDIKVKLFASDLKTMLERVLVIGTQNENLSLQATNEFKLTGLESFSLDYVVKWPLSLVITEITLLKYQIIFRHIFYMKHTERELCNVWLCSKSGELCLIRSSRHYSLACALKQRMLNFVQNLLNYMTFEVFEANWSVFEANLNNISNIDDLIVHHTNFLDNCLRDCMLTSKSFRSLHKLFAICNMFTDYIQALTKSVKSKEESIRLESRVNIQTAKAQREEAMQELKDNLNKIVNDDEFGKTISNFDKTFSDVLLDLLARIMNEMSSNLSEMKIGNIVNRLDFNDHYRDQLEKLRQVKAIQNKETTQKIQASFDSLNLK